MCLVSSKSVSDSWMVMLVSKQCTVSILIEYSPFLFRSMHSLTHLSFHLVYHLLVPLKGSSLIFFLASLMPLLLFFLSYYLYVRLGVFSNFVSRHWNTIGRFERSPSSSHIQDNWNNRMFRREGVRHMKMLTAILTGVFFLCLRSDAPTSSSYLPLNYMERQQGTLYLSKSLCSGKCKLVCGADAGSHWRRR